MPIHTRLAAVLAALAAIALVFAACSSSATRPPAVSLQDYFQRVQALHDTQESQSEVIAQRFAGQLSGDEAGLEETFAALARVLPEFLPDFRAVLQETRDGLTAITPPPDVEIPHADLIAAYDDLVAVLDRGSGQLQDGQTPTEVLSALFLDRSGDELAQRFSQIAAELAAVADAAGIEGFVGGGALVLQPDGVEETVVVERTGAPDETRGNDEPRARRVEPSSGVGPGLSVREAVSSRLTGLLLVNGFVVIADGETRLCQSLDQSQPPRCGDPSIILQGFEPEPGALTEAAGVAWTSDQVQVLGERVGERLIVSDTSLAN